MSNGGWTDARELAVPKKLFFYRNAVGGATDCIHDKRKAGEGHFSGVGDS